MKKNMINQTHIEGLLYEHKLEKKVSGDTSKNPGTEFITGTVSIATDEACLNVVSIHYTYFTATTKTGGANATYNTLNAILNGAKSVTVDGKENAVKVRADSAVALNEFYSNRNGEEQLVSARRNEGGFIHIITDPLREDERDRATFETDMVITGTREIEANTERNLPAKLVVKGYIFDFRKALLPIEFSVINPEGMKYFARLDCGPKSPVFTKVWGRQISQTSYRDVVEESAFGEKKVTRVPTSNKDYVITGVLTKDAMRDKGYVWDSEEGILGTEFAEALQNREVYLATVKQRQEDYQNAKKNATPAASNAMSGYNF